MPIPRQGRDEAKGDPGIWAVDSRSLFAVAGFVEVSHPSLRRVVMRIDFDR